MKNFIKYLFFDKLKKVYYLQLFIYILFSCRVSAQVLKEFSEIGLPQPADTAYSRKYEERFKEFSEIGFPQPVDTTYSRQYLDKRFFLISYVPDWKIPEWVAYHITAQDLKGSVGRTNNFRIDESLPKENQASISDYKGSGYDRGHMAPAADFKRSKASMESTFLLTNMTPQTPTLNRYRWAALEKYVRNLVENFGEAWIITGSLFLFDSPRVFPNKLNNYIGENVYIPTHLYKAVLIKQKMGRFEAFEAFACIMPNQKDKLEDLNYYIVTVDSLELDTGLDFFSKLDKETQDELESKPSSFFSTKRK